MFGLDPRCFRINKTTVKVNKKCTNVGKIRFSIAVRFKLLGVSIDFYSAAAGYGCYGRIIFGLFGEAANCCSWWCLYRQLNSQLINWPWDLRIKMVNLWGLTRAVFMLDFDRFNVATDPRRKRLSSWVLSEQGTSDIRVHWLTSSYSLGNDNVFALWQPKLWTAFLQLVLCTAKRDAWCTVQIYPCPNSFHNYRQSIFVFLLGIRARSYEETILVICRAFSIRIIWLTEVF